MFYTGVGSRETPLDVLGQMQRAAIRLSDRGYTLRSGGARGADTAFAKGAGQQAVIYIPWAGFMQSPEVMRLVPAGSPEWVAAAKLVSTLHPKWSSLSNGARALHTRNVFQVLGDKLDSPSAFVLCWTPCGAESEADCNRTTGGTATAIKVASRHGVPVFNLKRPDVLQRWAMFF